MDAATVKARFSRAVTTYDAQAGVQRTAAARLWELAAAHVRPGARVLEIGAGTGLLSRRLLAAQPGRLVLNDVCTSPQAALLAREHPQTVACLEGDAMRVVWDGTYDSIVSASAFQWFPDLSALFARCARHLAGDGLLAFSSFLPGNLQEVTRLTGVGLRYADTGELRRLLAPTFSILHMEEETAVRHFAAPRDVLLHLRETGVTGIRTTVWNTRRYAAFVRDYAALYGDGDGVRLTYRPVYVLARKTWTGQGNGQ
ncbi:MAG: methyltransferase domain-containing protein [Desulfovibrio sp.]|nr:methyltransferase domain-containing protein [Desulfovibrio sp.]